jgi:fructokinase
MDRSGTRTIVGLGELLWDCFAEGRRPGGAPANVAFHAGQLGDRGVICSRVGDDADGRELLAALRSHGVSTDAIQLDPRLPTGRVTVDASDPGRPSYVIHENVAWDAIAYDDALERLLDSAAALCVGSLAQRSETSRTTIRRCLERASGALRVYDVNLRPGGSDRSWIEATLAQAEVVKLNEDEVRTLDEMFALGSAEPGEFGRRLLERFGGELVCVTRGERGCMLASKDEVVEQAGAPQPPPRAGESPDAVGAGDAFTAALIAARLRDWPLERTARLANEVGALVASREGAMPDLREELKGRVEDG